VLKAKERMYIDARHEKFQLGSAKQVIYAIEGVNEENVKERILSSIGLHSLKIEIVPKTEKVIITYYENLISPSYIDYIFQLQGFSFIREN